jgi:hypothetical protein
MSNSETKNAMPTISARMRRVRLIEFLQRNGGHATVAVTRVNLGMTAHELSSVSGDDTLWGDGWNIVRQVNRNTAELQLVQADTNAPQLQIAE